MRHPCAAHCWTNGIRVRVNAANQHDEVGRVLSTPQLVQDILRSHRTHAGKNPSRAPNARRPVWTSGVWDPGNRALAPPLAFGASAGYQWPSMYSHAANAAGDSLQSTVKHPGPISFSKPGSRPTVAMWKPHRGPTTREGYRSEADQTTRRHRRMNARMSNIERLGSR